MKKYIGILIIIFIFLSIFSVLRIIDHMESYDRNFRNIKTADGRIEFTFRKYTNYPDTLILRKIENEEEAWELTWNDYFAHNRDHFYKLPAGQYILTGNRLIFPLTLVDKEGYLYREMTALDYRFGEILWSTPVPLGLTQDHFYSIADETSVYVLNLHQMEGGFLTHLDIKTGEEIWTMPCLDKATSPLMMEDTLILHSDKESRAAVIDKETGRILYIPSDYTGFIREEAFIHIREQEGVYTVHSTDQKTGETEELITLRDRPMEEEYGRKLFAMAGDLFLYQTEGSALKAVNYRTGRTAWQIQWNKDSMGRIYRLAFFPSGGLRNTSPRNSLFYDIQPGFMPILLYNYEGERAVYRLCIIDPAGGRILSEGENIQGMDIGFANVLYIGGEYYIIKDHDDDTHSVFVLNSASGEFTRFLRIKDTVENADLGRGLINRLLEGDPSLPWKTGQTELAKNLSLYLGIE